MYRPSPFTPYSTLTSKSTSLCRSGSRSGTVNPTLIRTQPEHWIGAVRSKQFFAANLRKHAANPCKQNFRQTHRCLPRTYGEFVQSHDNQVNKSASWRTTPPTCKHSLRANVHRNSRQTMFASWWTSKLAAADIVHGEHPQTMFTAKYVCQQ